MRPVVKSQIGHSQTPNFSLTKYQMQTTDQHPGSLSFTRRRSAWPGLLAVCMLLLALVIATGCTRSSTRSTKTSPAAREAALRQIAADFARSGDLAQAQAALGRLDLANPAQLLISLAEGDVSAGRPAEELQPLARLAEALGARSPKLMAYLAPTPEPTMTRLPATPTQPAPTALPAATMTPVSPTNTLPPPTATDTPAPQKPRVLAQSNVNLRGGPGKAYPVVGQLRSGQEVDIIGRNASGDWWQLAWTDVRQAWVAGTVVSVLGAIDTVAVAQNIPTAAPQPTAAPRPTSAPAPTTAPAKPSTEFVVKNVRVRAVGESSQTCASGEHNVFVQVIDPGGNPIDNVRVRDVWTNTILVTGAQGKGAGRVDFDIYKDGGAQLEIVNDANNPISPPSRGMSANLPDWDLFQAAGYCNCKPYPDTESCRAGWEARDFNFMPMSHYVYEVIFQRTY